MSQSDIPIYQFMIFGSKLRLIYYRNLSDSPETLYDYAALNLQSRIMNTIGTAIQMSRVSQIFTPTKDMVFRCFKTNQYRFSMFETANEVRMVLFSSLKEEGVDFGALFQQLWGVYVDAVKRNYLYEQGEVIEIPKFKEGTNAIFKEIAARKGK